MGERAEALWRIPIAVVAAIILGAWGVLVSIAIAVHWILTLVAGRRSRSLAKFANHYVSYRYSVCRYLGMTTNMRPFPFAKYAKPLEPVHMQLVKLRVKKGRKG